MSGSRAGYVCAMSDASRYGAGAYPPPLEQRRGVGMAITALVLGVLALLFCWTVVGGILFGLVAIIVGFIASRRAKRGIARRRGMAVAGIVLGLIGLLLWTGLVAVGVSTFSSDSGTSFQSCVKGANGDQTALDKCSTEFQGNLGG